MQTTVFESISAVIPPTDPTDVLPSVPVIAGWNLLGIVDISQGEAGHGADRQARSGRLLRQHRLAGGLLLQECVERLAEDRSGRRAIGWRVRDSER